ncbi:MAG: type II toxin-antitoxin system VapC family toxin [Calditrichaeota bacterium]|nr:MAG: type II toxin-antitoxin system VapC family toxin [Calditrichota bacterium]
MLKKNLVVLDTNVIIRFLIGDNEELYEKSVRIFSEIENDRVKAVVLESVIAETVFVLEKVYRVERNLIAELLIKILDLKGVRNGSRQIYRRALETYQAKNIDIVDCLICAHSVVGEMEVVSFDKDIETCRKLLTLSQSKVSNL